MGLGPRLGLGIRRRLARERDNAWLGLGLGLGPWFRLGPGSVAQTRTLTRRAPAERGRTRTKGACRAKEGAQLWVIGGRVPQQRTRGVRRAHQLVGLQADVELPGGKLGAARSHSLCRREDCGGGFGVARREVRRVLLQRALHGDGCGWQHESRQPCVRLARLV